MDVEQVAQLLAQIAPAAYALYKQHEGKVKKPDELNLLLWAVTYEKLNQLAKDHARMKEEVDVLDTKLNQMLNRRAPKRKIERRA